jgi:uncharacterized LabA/DUF88 family protein
LRVKKTVVLIDAGFLRVFLPKTFGFSDLARIIEAFALACVSPEDGEEMHRVLYYDCPPYEGSAAPHPLDATRTPNSPAHRNFWNAVLSQLKAKPHFAVRLGEMSFDGWALTRKATWDLVEHRRPPLPGDFMPVLRQNGVDLRIGLDVALMAKDHLVDRIVIVSGDADIVPAMKAARREGVQVVLASMGHGIKPSLKEHADLYRDVDLPGVIAALYPDRVPIRSSRN